MKNNYYDILGVSPDVTQKEIKKAYRVLAFEWHPDKNESLEAEEMFKKINEANETLSDEGQRKAYDAILEAERLRAKKIRPQKQQRAQSKPVHSKSNYPTGSSTGFGFAFAAIIFVAILGLVLWSLSKEDLEEA